MVGKFSLEKRYVCEQGWKCHDWPVNMYFTNQSMIQRGRGGGGAMKLNFEGLQMQKWNIATDRIQKVRKGNGFICLVIMFTPAVMVIKMSKMAHFLHFFFLLLLFSPFGKCYGLFGSEVLSTRCQSLKIQDFGAFFIDSTVSKYFYP